MRGSSLLLAAAAVLAASGVGVAATASATDSASSAAGAAAPPGVVSPTACHFPANLKLGVMKYVWELLTGPATPSEQPAWLAAMRKYRAGCRAALHLSDAAYTDPQLAWTQRAFVQPLVMPFDKALFDPTTGQYTVDKYIDKMIAQYGGVDSVLLWPTYPQLGVDDRNQFQFTASLPGGLSGLRAMTQQFHARNVTVTWPYNPWDQGTHGGTGNGSAFAKDMSGLEGPPAQALLNDGKRLAAFLAATDGDGFFGDTITTADLNGFAAMGLAATGRRMAAGGEAGAVPAALNYSTIGWNYWNRDYNPANHNPLSLVPPVTAMKWLEPRYRNQGCDRWLRNKTDMLQIQYFNADGVVPWQNIWGVYSPMTDYDSETLRRTASILRFFHDLGGFTEAQGWVPHTPTLQPLVFASAWPVGNETLYTLVNRGGADITGPQLVVPSAQAATGRSLDRFFDCYHGEEIQIQMQLQSSKHGSGSLSSVGTLAFLIERNGYGCVFATPQPPSEQLTAFLRKMKAMTSTARLDSFSQQWRGPVNQTMTPIAPSSKTHPAAGAPPPGMVAIPETKAWTFAVCGTEIEGAGQWGGPAWDNTEGLGADVQFPWETAPRMNHSHVLNLPPYFLDTTPVTNAQYSNYLAASKYAPRDRTNFLKDWSYTTANRSYEFPAAWDKKPVTHVSLEDARAFCRWEGKRLPHSYEWQRAAQGTDGRLYPWGNDSGGAADGTRCPKLQTHEQDLQPPADVDAYPSGAAESGAMDLLGNAWEYTDEFSDEHSRAVVLRGGSRYMAAMLGSSYSENGTITGGNYYFPGGQGPLAGLASRRLNTHGKYFLMGASWERAGTIGFRCAMDASAA